LLKVKHRAVVRAAACAAGGELLASTAFAQAERQRPFAMTRVSNMDRQSKCSGVGAVPERYAALARVAYRSFNTELVSQIVKARSK
jgi:hypothetical protein